MKKNKCTDYFTELKPVDCSTTCCGATGRFISNYPEITRIYPPNYKGSTQYTMVQGYSGIAVIQGYNFNSTKGVYLSATDNNALASAASFSTPLSTFNLYSGIQCVSGTFTSFTGYKLKTFAIIDNNHIQINIPEVNSAVTINVILENPVGHNVPFITRTDHQIHVL